MELGRRSRAVVSDSIRSSGAGNCREVRDQPVDAGLEGRVGPVASEVSAVKRFLEARMRLRLRYPAQGGGGRIHRGAEHVAADHGDRVNDGAGIESVRGEAFLGMALACCARASR